MAEKIVSIGVHIWKPGKYWEPNGDPEIEDTSSYVSSRARRLSQGPANQVLLIPDNFFSDAKTFLKLGPEWNDHLIKTHLDSSLPKEMKFDQLRAWILDQFPATRYDFWGTEVYTKKGKPVDGCTKRTMHYLKLPNSHLDLTSCWVAEAPKGNPWRKAVESVLTSGWSMP